MEENLALAVKVTNLPSGVTEEKIKEATSVGGTFNKIILGYEEAILIFSDENAAEQFLNLLHSTFIGGKEAIFEKATSMKVKLESDIIIDDIDLKQSEERIKKLKEVEEAKKQEEAKKLEESKKLLEEAKKLEESKKFEEIMIKQQKIDEEAEFKANSSVIKMLNVLNISNVPARNPMRGDDLFAAVYNRKYGITIVGMWTLYLVLINILRSASG